MKILEILFFYQCYHMCYSVDTMDDSSDIDRGNQNELFGNPHGILAQGLLDPRNTESVFKTLLYDLDNQYNVSLKSDVVNVHMFVLPHICSQIFVQWFGFLVIKWSPKIFEFCI